MSVVLYKRRLAPQKYIRAHESRGVTNLDMFSTCCFVQNGYGYGRIHQYVCTGTGTGMAWVWVRPVNR